MYVESVMIICITLGCVVGTYLFNTRKFNPKIVIFIGSVFILIGCFSASFTKEFYWFVICWGLNGIGCGMIYLPPM